jgi:glucose-1-phosphate thymidylyltransferase
MKGIILAGGLGSRLGPITQGVSKHLLPVYDKPMIYYPLSVLMLAGIRDILLITHPDDLHNFQRLFGDGSDLGLRIEYAAQLEPRGLADAFLIGKAFIDAQPVALILGDNFFFGQGFVPLLQGQTKRTRGAGIFAHPVPDPRHYGVIELNAQHSPISIEEKPHNPRSSLAQTGLGFYGPEVVEMAEQVRPSLRGELEITDLHRLFLQAGRLDVLMLGRGFAWLDTGTHESLLEAGQFVATIEKRQGLKVGCLEEIALRSGWITPSDVLHRASRIGDNSYKRYLLELAEHGAVDLLQRPVRPLHVKPKEGHA